MTIRAEGPQLSPEWREGKCQERGTYRSFIDTQECDHVGRVAEQETCGAGEPHSTSSFGFRARVNAPIGQAAFREVPPDSAFWVFSRTRGINEMLRVCLDDHETLELLTSAAEDFARATAPDEARKSFMLATMAALQKKDGGVRGIATGSFRRLVAKTLARQFGKAVEATCSPFQFALSTRAGKDCVGHAEQQPTGTPKRPFFRSMELAPTITSTGVPCWANSSRS